MKDKFFPENILQSFIFIISYILIAGSLSLILSKFIGDGKILLHIYFSVGSAIVVFLAHLRNSSSGTRIKYDLRIARIPLLLTLFAVTGIFHLGIISPIFKGLLIDAKSLNTNSNSLFSLDDFIGFVILAPVYEEIIFRNIVLRGLLRKYSSYKSILISSVLFALIHIDVAHIYFGKIVTAFFLGLFLGWIFYKTRRIGLCIVIHVFSNFIALFNNSLHEFILTNFQNDLLPEATYWAIILLAVVSMTLILMHLKKEYQIFK